MEIQHNQYRIVITNASNYTLNSSDNIEEFNIEYYQGKLNEDRVYPTSKHGIRIFLNNLEINSAIIYETGGATGIDTNSFIVEESNILICCCDIIYSLKIPDLSINWFKRFDPATCFSIYKFKEDLIIHGELQISRIDFQGNEKWNFSARDIFVTQDGKDSIQVDQETIKLIDWAENKYLLNEHGKVVNNKLNLFLKKGSIKILINLLFKPFFNCHSHHTKKPS